MTFADQLLQSIETIYQRILSHPFNMELAAGTLSLDKFAYYMQQDELYIRDYTRALALLAAKSPSLDIANDLLSYARDGVTIERNLHDHFFIIFRIESASEQQPACFAYANFLLATAALQPFEIGIAAILPCFWIYRELGESIAHKANDDNPYQLWIDTYADETYSGIVDRMIEITEQISRRASETTKSKMRRAFIHSTHLEYLFCDAAYRQEKWPHFAF
ncbi:thiaminase II [candidate division KSB1 bacterium]|nr:thiaminase II [candidate division KSB1 bacterium]